MRVPCWAFARLLARQIWTLLRLGSLAGVHISSAQHPSSPQSFLDCHLTLSTKTTTKQKMEAQPQMSIYSGAGEEAAEAIIADCYKLAEQYAGTEVCPSG